MPGEKITSTDDFCAFIEGVAKGKDDFAAARKELLNKIHVYQDGNSSERVVNLMLGR
jgi:CDP-glycerol glycerophosphotransferase (TagB/SpsB family)